MVQRSAEDYARMYARCLPDVLRYARRRVGPDAAWDVAAETFLVAWRRAKQVPDDPLPWLYAVARRVVANELRRRQRAGRLTGAVGSAGEAPVQPGPGLPVAEVLRGLPARDREVRMLVGWEGLDTAAAARVLGCSAATFAVRLHRARRRLERALADAEPVEGTGALVEGEAHA